MKTIYKYKLYSLKTLIELPCNHEILHVNSQDNTPTIWIKVDTDQTNIQPKIFYVFATGQPLPENVDSMVFIGTAHCGTLVWHIFSED